jgi:hypothetical protein
VKSQVLVSGWNTEFCAFLYFFCGTGRAALCDFQRCHSFLLSAQPISCCPFVTYSVYCEQELINLSYYSVFPILLTGTCESHVVWRQSLYRKRSGSGDQRGEHP